MKSSRFPILFVVFLIGLAGMTASADSMSPPRSYQKLSSDGRYVFVMLAPQPVEDEVRTWNDETAAGIRAIRGRYTQSGLYRNDGSITPLWTITWYAYEVNVASDGIHLVRHGPWASSTAQEAFSFFANGQLIRGYKISELVDRPEELPHSVSHFVWSDGGRLDDRDLHFHIGTRDGNSFVFSAATGEAISVARSQPIRHRIVLLLTIVLAGSIVLWQVRRRRNARRVRVSSLDE